jgi:hypothetical protein
MTFRQDVASTLGPGERFGLCCDVTYGVVVPDPAASAACGAARLLTPVLQGVHRTINSLLLEQAGLKSGQADGEDRR